MKRLIGAALLAVALTACSPTASAPSVPDPAAVDSVAAVAPVSRPTRIRIPALGVDANIIDLGLQPDGKMEVPPDATDAGWYTGSPSPGGTGPAVIAAHVNWKGTDGPFAKLDQLKAGDRVEVEHDNGTVSVFEVERVEEHSKAAFPADEVYGDTAEPQLRLVTCGGDFDPATGHYRANVIAFATLAA